MKSWKRCFSITLKSLKFRRGRPDFKRNLSTNILPTDLPPHILNPFKYFNQKLRKIVQFYEEFSGIKDVRLAQEKVEEAGDRLMVIQEERRKAFATLLEIQSNLKGIYAQLENTRRGDDRYINLITEEYRLIKQEEVQQEKFRSIEKAERDQFTLFTHSVKTTHEKEKAQSQKTKYWSIIGSVVGTMIGIIGSSLSSRKKQSELKMLIAETSNSKLELELNKFLEGYKKIEETKYSEEINNIRNNLLDDIMNNTTADGNSKMHVYLNELLSKTNSILLNLEETLKIMENINQFEMYKVKSDSGSDVFFMNLQSLKDALHYENQQMRDVFWKGSLIVGGAIFIRSCLQYFCGSCREPRKDLAPSSNELDVSGNENSPLTQTIKHIKINGFHLSGPSNY